MHSHGAVAEQLLGVSSTVVDQVLQNPEQAPISDKMKALLQIAAQVARSGNAVSKQDINYAREQGASDRDVHDAVLVAAAFSMFNRYVDGLATHAPRDRKSYKMVARRLAEQGYVSAGK